MSMTVSVAVPATVRRRASTSSTAPLADCTRLAVTTSKSAAADTNSPGANSVIVTPLPACAANGKVALVNSTATVATPLPSGTAGPPGQAALGGAPRARRLVERRRVHRSRLPRRNAVLQRVDQEPRWQAI